MQDISNSINTTFKVLIETLNCIKEEIQSFHKNLSEVQTKLSQLQTTQNEVQGCLTSSESVPVLVSLFRMMDNFHGRDDRKILVDGIMEIIENNPAILHRYVAFRDTFKSKCLELIRTERLQSAKSAYLRHFSDDMVSLKESETSAKESDDES